MQLGRSTRILGKIKQRYWGYHFKRSSNCSYAVSFKSQQALPLCRYGSWLKMSWHDLNHSAKVLIRSYLDEKNNDTMNTVSWCDDPVSMGVLLGQTCLNILWVGIYNIELKNLQQLATWVPTFIFIDNHINTLYFIYVPTFAASSTPQRGWQTSGKRRILGRQSSQCNADAWIERDFGFQSDGQGREQRCQTFEASSLEAETTGRLFQESHRECSLLEKAQVELHSWLQVKVQGLHYRYKATGHDRRVLCFSTLLGSASFWALPDYVTRAGQKVTAGQTGASS